MCSGAIDCASATSKAGTWTSSVGDVSSVVFSAACPSADSDATAGTRTGDDDSDDTCVGRTDTCVDCATVSAGATRADAEDGAAGVGDADARGGAAVAVAADAGDGSACVADDGDVAA